MGGVEVGGGSVTECQDIGKLLMINRELALEAARERADRVIFGFRRTGVFERTFRRRLQFFNGLLGFTQVAEGGFVPEGYHDPHADLSNDQSEH